MGLGATGCELTPALAKNGLLKCPDELDVDRPVLMLVLDAIPVGFAAVEPNGLVLLGLVAGIRFSRLTNEEFSPRKLSGVFRTPVVVLVLVVSVLND